MFGRLSSVLMLVLTGCGEPGAPLERLIKAWAAETGVRATDSIASTLVLAGLASEMCPVATLSPDEWENPGELPISVAMHQALGTPVVHEVEYASGGAVQMTLEDVSIGGRQGQWLRFSMLAGENAIQFEFEPLVADEDVGDETARLDGFGHTSVAIDNGCAPENAMVSGQALWVDPSGRHHDISIPADSNLGSGLVFGGSEPWLPESGTLSWDAKIDGQQRSLVTESGFEIRTDDNGEARWPVTVHGPDWTGSALILIAL